MKCERPIKNCFQTVKCSFTLIAFFFFPWLLFITGFKQFDRDVPCSNFLHTSCTWILFSFLIYEFIVFIEFENYLVVIYSTLFCCLPSVLLSFGDSSSIYIWPFEVVSTLTDVLLVYLFFLVFFTSVSLFG